MSDLINQLKSLGDNPNLPQYCMEICESAAARMESLEAELAKARADASDYHSIKIELAILRTVKDHAVREAQIHAQEARTQRSIVIGILSDLSLPEIDYAAQGLVAEYVAALRKQNSELALQVLADEGQAMGEYDAPIAVAPSEESIERAAKMLAMWIDYPWCHMPEERRENMRENVRKIIAVAAPKQGD